MFSIPSGTYTSIQTVTISGAAPGTAIYYTSYVSGMNSGSFSYTGPIVLSSSVSLDAYTAATGSLVLDGIAADYGPTIVSPEVIASYTINLPLASAPTFNLVSGNYTSPQTLIIGDTTPGAAIYYTTDGTTPTDSSTVYTGPVTVSTSQTIQAIATASGYATSAVATAQYTMNLASADFSLTASSSSLTINAGQSGSFSLSLTPVNGFNSVVSFSCSGLPAGISCSFSPATVTPNGGPIATTVTVTASATASANKFGRDSLMPTFLAMMFGCFWWRRGPRLRLPLLLLLSVVSLVMLNGCGGSSTGSSSSCQPVTSTVTVVATAGSLQHTTAILLSVE